MAWVQLLSIQHIEKAGVSRTYYPGDWVSIGDQSAQRLITDGLARFATPQKLDGTLGGGGVVITGEAGRADKLRTALPKLAITVAPADGERKLPYARTLFWDTSLSLRSELVPVGLKLLSTWEVAAPLWSYDELALHVGTQDARERTQAVIRDLRVPLYDTRLVFVRRCRAGEAFIETWNEEFTSGDDARLALLRAIYRVKPLLCALPMTWTNKQTAA